MEMTQKTTRDGLNSVRLTCEAPSNSFASVNTKEINLDSVVSQKPVSAQNVGKYGVCLMRTSPRPDLIKCKMSEC